jgi:hypothetical protein
MPQCAELKGEGVQGRLHTLQVMGKQHCCAGPITRQAQRATCPFAPIATSFAPSPARPSQRPHCEVQWVMRPVGGVHEWHQPVMPARALGRRSRTPCSAWQFRIFENRCPPRLTPGPPRGASSSRPPAPPCGTCTMVPGPGSKVSARWAHPPVGQVAASWWPVPKALPQSTFSFFYFCSRPTLFGRHVLFTRGGRCIPRPRHPRLHPAHTQ